VLPLFLQSNRIGNRQRTPPNHSTTNPQPTQNQPSTNPNPHPPHPTNAEGTANEEREQTLNQLLTEMDGFTPDTGVVFIGATNR